MILKWLKRVAIATVILLILLSWPKPDLLNELSFSTEVRAANGQLLRLTTSRDQQYRLFVPLSEIPKPLIDATLWKEDRHYYRHLGVNPFSMMRAFFQTYILRQRVIGASTITMQVARLRYHIDSHHWYGKIKQIIIALQLELHYSKAQILEAYFNLAPYGRNIEGVKAASIIYYNQPLSRLSLPQWMTLAVIPQNPVARTPRSLKKLTEARAKLYESWVKRHPADKRYSSLMALPLALQPIEQLPFLAPHFVDFVLQKHSPTSTLQTTLDPQLQKIMELTVRNYLQMRRNNGLHNAAALLVDTRDMSVKAMVGSADFMNQTISGQVNGTTASRSPGSTLKPFIYALAFDQGVIHPASVLKDTPMHFGSFDPENFDYHFMGPLPAKEALVLSRNIPAIYLASLLKKPSFYEFLQQAGIQMQSEQELGLGLVIGNAELSMTQLVRLYAMLSNNGVYHALRYYQDEPIDGGMQLLSPEASFMTKDILEHNPRPMQIVPQQDLPVAWKTGTSSGYRDAWSVGLFGPYALAVWIGNFDNSKNTAFVGQTAAAPLFFAIVDNIKHQNRVKPLKTNVAKLHLEKVKVCAISGMLPTHYCPGTEETWFIPGKSPIQTDTVFREVMINPKTHKRACHFASDTQFAIYEFWPSDILAIFKEAGIARRTPPPFDNDCAMQTETAGIAPKITSPRNSFIYTLSPRSPDAVSVVLQATVDADVHKLYWFANKSFIGQTNAKSPMLWHAIPGIYVVRVVDEFGRADAVKISVTNVV